ncbi:MAG: RidA family protein [Chloroflexi bacterium]|nr:RidA family protein [Chloroflexota bacterium]
MPHQTHNPDDAPAPIGGYAQGLEVRPNARYLFISGQIPESVGAEVPDGFEAQCRLVWRNIEAVLRSAGMELSDLVQVRTYLTHPDQVEANSRIRQEVLSGVQPALTVIMAQTLESQWLLEIEAVAAQNMERRSYRLTG